MTHCFLPILSRFDVAVIGGGLVTVGGVFVGGRREAVVSDDPLERRFRAAVNKEVPRPTSYGIAENESTLAKVGDTILCLGTTSCGLVLGYTAKGQVACYHWPFMTNSAEYHGNFADIVGQLDSDIVFILVITNDFPKGDGRAYQAAVASIAAKWGVPLTYLVQANLLKGDPMVRLASTGYDWTGNPLKTVDY